MANYRIVELSNGTSVGYDYTVLNNMLSKLKGKHVKVVADGVNYGVYWELGHMRGETMYQHPFMVPAAEKWRKPLKEALRKAIETKACPIDDVIDKVAHGVERDAKLEIEKAKDKGNGKITDLVDTGALVNSITVLDPEDV